MTRIQLLTEVSRKLFKSILPVVNNREVVAGAIAAACLGCKMSKEELQEMLNEAEVSKDAAPVMSSPTNMGGPSGLKAANIPKPTEMQTFSDDDAPKATEKEEK